MSFWSRIRRLWRPPPAENEEPEPVPPPPDEDETVAAPPDPLQLCRAPTSATISAEEQRLLELFERLAPPSGADEAPPDETLLGWLDALERAGHERRALELMQRLAELLPRAPLRLRLAERLYAQRKLDDALPLLEGLLDDADCACHAHFLLGDHLRREADLAAALRHFEHVLAIDVRYPRARARADDLRDRLDRPLAAAAPTILGESELGAGGRFILERELGRGGGGTVYLALDRTLRRPLAVKVLHPRVAQQPEARAHLFCEARIAASLHHPQIVAIYDLDESLNLVAMEYCHGGTLAARIEAGPLAPGLAFERLTEMARVLAAVHRAGVVHRDLKPANWLLRRPAHDAPLVLSDFGIAHAVAEQPHSDEVVGSRAYMAPEQRRGRATDPRIDIFACGVIAIELLLGRPSLSPQQALQGVHVDELPDIWRDLEQVLPATLRQDALSFLRQLVAADPARRPDDASQCAERARALADAAADQARRRALIDELQRRAGAAPRPPAVQRWLARHATGVNSGDETC